MDWKENFQKGKEIILSTCNDNYPNANIVESLGFVDSKILIKDVQMNLTLKNLKKNNKICIIGGYIRLRGDVEIYSSGKYFDLCRDGDTKYPAKNAILVNITEVFDLDKVKIIK